MSLNPRSASTFGQPLAFRSVHLAQYGSPQSNERNFARSRSNSLQWEGWIASIAQGIVGGGPAGLVWGWVFVSLGIVVLAASLAEFVR